MRRRRRETEQLGLSFLDAICCGFGAIILLLVLSKSAEPVLAVESTEQLESLEAELRALAEQTAGEARALDDELAASRQRLEAAQKELQALLMKADTLRDRSVESETENEVAQLIEERLASARQSLTEEMRRLYRTVRVTPDAPVAGIPVDSEYIVFVIDTSGSMRQYAWRSVADKLTETLNLYPRVRGLQVLSDMGEYMFSQYRGQWIPDTPGRRKAVISRLNNWTAFSNSSPVEGIEAAIRGLARPDKKISIYVFGDEFTGDSIERVVQRLRVINPRTASGQPRVRIHGLGFPTQYTRDGIRATGVRFASLMRTVCHENAGTFVGLEESR